MKKLIGLGIFVLILAAAVFGGKWVWNKFFTENKTVEYTTRKAEISDMRRTIASTGTVEPEELVNVGAQVGGMITVFGKDASGGSVDYGSKVKAGGILAKIDDSLYVAERDISKANVLQAQASIASSEANVIQTNAKFALAKSNWDRAQRLQPQGIIAKSDFDSAESEYHSADAARALAEAGLKQSKAQLIANEATLAKNERNLGYCVISSPVDGVIIDRRVNIGQTVNASMNAPSLFLIAKDLKRMQVWVSVNEADIGEIRMGQKVLFTVDAFPGRTFEGKVRKIRLNATMSQNVVTYVVEIETDNSDNTLLPYLTANVKFILEERSGVLTVPNAAFRFTPAAVPASNPGPGEKVLWILENGTPRALSVKTGLNDGSRTEIIGNTLPADAQIITGSRIVTKQSEGNADSSDATNPFLPKMPPHPGEKKK